MAEVLLRGAVSSLAGGWAAIRVGPGPALPDINLVREPAIVFIQPPGCS